MKKEIIALMTFLLFVATASAYYYDYYQYYDAYPYYTYVDYYSYQPYYEYYPSGYDSYYFYYEESPQYEDTHYTDIANCQNPYGTEGQKKCFDSALYVCSRGGWSFDRDVQCCSADECQPEQLGDYCYSAKSCSSYQCSSGYQTYCPQPGTKKGSTCYYGDRECTKSGCSIQKCILQRDQRCDAWQGCVDVQCDAAECDAKDGWYCLGGDVTREYRDYYCTHDTGQSCSYRISDRETKTDEWVCDGDYRERVHYTCTNGNIYSSITSSTFCEDGCSSGQCMDDNEDCDGRDGYYGSNFCRNDNVYRQYKNYYSSGYGCSYNTENRRVENCDHGCEDGRCVNEEDCDSRDGFYGERYCRNNNVYQNYRNYYHSGSGCSYSTQERLRETCIDGCSDGQCYGSAECEYNVDIRDGEFYPQTITVPRGTTVRWTNQDHEEHTVTSDDGTFHSGALDEDEVYSRTFTETGYFYYQCDYHSGEHGTVHVTTDGSCEATCDYNCDSKDGFYGDNFCSGGNVKREYRDYYCSGSSCTYSAQYRTVEDCKGGCSDGKCTETKCESRCDDWGEWQKLSGKMERRRTCYSYTLKDGSCVLSKSYIAIQQAPLNGVDSEAKHRVYEFDFSVESSTGDKPLSHEAVRLYNGLIFGSNKIAFVLKKGTYIGDLTFNVDDTNSYGNIIVLLGDKTESIKDAGKGQYKVVFEKTLESDTELTIMAESSWWKLWAPTTYDISQVSLATKAEIVRTDSFDFELYQDEYDGFMGGSLTTMPSEGVKVLVNDKEFSGTTFGKDFVKVGANTVELVPLKGMKHEGKLVLDISYAS